MTHPPPPPTEGELKLFGVPLADVIARAPCPEDPSVPELVYRYVAIIIFEIHKSVLDADPRPSNLN